MAGAAAGSVGPDGIGAGGPAPWALCSVLIPSCDAYADLWTPFFTLFWRFWPDCPFPVYLGTNQCTFRDPRVRCLPSDQGTNWANRVRQHVAAIPTPYVLLVLEDFFWRRTTPTREVVTLLGHLQALDGQMLRLTNRPPPDDPVAGYTTLGRLQVGAPFRASTQAAFWRTSTLLELLAPDESIWDFEVIGSWRSRKWEDGFYCTWRQVLPYGYHVVEKGKWFRHEARRFGRMRIGCDFSARPVMTRREAFQAGTAWLKSWVLHRLPWRARLRVQALAQQWGL